MNTTRPVDQILGGSLTVLDEVLALTYLEIHVDEAKRQKHNLRQRS